MFGQDHLIFPAMLRFAVITTLLFNIALMLIISLIGGWRDNGENQIYFKRYLFMGIGYVLSYFSLDRYWENGCCKDFRLNIFFVCKLFLHDLNGGI